MNARLLTLWDNLQSSYWFLPALMTVGAVVLSFVLTAVDGNVGSSWIDEVDWLYDNKPEGARTLLSTVAGSMIGVAGVTFSITIASVVYASGQYGPRLLSNFMRDRGNQITLGTFIATFLYCLLVLRTIRAADEGYGGDNPADDVVGPFVPHLAILFGIALTVASIAVLIYFIHHVPKSILVSNVIAGVGHELVDRMDTLFPERFGESGHVPGAASMRLPPSFDAEARPVHATTDGYIQSIAPDDLFEKADRHGLVLRLRHRPGDFVTTGETVLQAWPGTAVDDDLAASLRHSVTTGRSRTPLQDVRFLINELVEIAARALSTGVNDPFTAINCLDWLGAAMKRTDGRDIPTEARFAEDGALRMMARPTTYASLVEAAFGQLRPYVAADRNAALYTLKTLGDVGGQTHLETARGVLRREAQALVAEASVLSETDRDALNERLAVVLRVLGSGDYESEAGSSDWLGGSA